MFKKFSLLDLVFPTFCCHCGKIGNYLCPKCYEKLEFTVLPIQTKLEPLYLDSLTAVLDFNETCKSLIHTLKYQSVKKIGNFCGQFLYGTADYPSVDLVIAVPLHPNRQRERGFNQAAVIAASFAKWAQLPFVPMLERKVFITNQASLTTDADRQKNIADNFQVLPTALALAHKSVLIIDDVTTTGATLNECAKVLKNAGFSQVHGLTMAHGY